MCKQALRLAPAPPACTPNHHNHKVVGFSSQRRTTMKELQVNRTGVHLSNFKKSMDSTGKYNYLLSWWSEEAGRHYRERRVSNTTSSMEYSLWHHPSWQKLSSEPSKNSLCISAILCTLILFMTIIFVFASKRFDTCFLFITVHYTPASRLHIYIIMIKHWSPIHKTTKKRHFKIISFLNTIWIGTCITTPYNTILTKQKHKFHHSPATLFTKTCLLYRLQQSWAAYTRFTLFVRCLCPDHLDEDLTWNSLWPSHLIIKYAYNVTYTFLAFLKSIFHLEHSNLSC